MYLVSLFVCSVRNKNLLNRIKTLFLKTSEKLLRMLSMLPLPKLGDILYNNLKSNQIWFFFVENILLWSFSRIIQKLLQSVKMFWFRGNVKSVKSADNHFSIKIFWIGPIAFEILRFFVLWNFTGTKTLVLLWIRKKFHKPPNIDFYWSKLFSEILPFWDRVLKIIQAYRKSFQVFGE